MHKFNVTVGTSTGRNLPMQFIFVPLEEDKIVTNKELTTKLCKGCKMYGNRGGCPPLSPDYDKVFRGKFKYHYLVIGNIPVIHWMGEKVRNMDNRSRMMMFTSSFIEVMFKGLEKQIVSILKYYGGRVFPSSWCNLCKGCATAKGEPCRKPKDRCYSMEATGILVENTIMGAGLGRLEWFEWKTKKIPKWIKKIILYSTNNILSYEELQEDLLKTNRFTLMNFTSTTKE